MKMAPSHLKVLSTELPNDLDFGVSAQKKFEKKRTDDFYTDLKNIPKLYSQNKDKEKYSDHQRTEKTIDALNFPKNVSKFYDVRKCDEETEPQNVERDSKSDLQIIMNAEGAYYYEKDKKNREEDKMRSKLSRFFSIFSCLKIKCKRKTEQIDDLERSSSFKEEFHRGCNLKVSVDVSASGKNERNEKSKIVTLLVTRGPDRLRGLKGTELPYFKQQQINKRTWSGGSIISTEYHKKYDTLKNIPRTQLDLIGAKDDKSLYPQNILISLDRKNNERINDDLNLLMEIVRESGNDKLADENSDWGIEQISNAHLNSLSNNINETDESHYSKILPVAEIEMYLRSNELGLEHSIKDVVQNTNFNFVQTESVLNENCLNNTNAINYASFSDHCKHSSSTDGLLSTVGLNEAQVKMNDSPPKIVVTTSSNSNYTLDSPSEKFISIPEPYVGTYGLISPESSPITNPVNPSSNVENSNDINCIGKYEHSRKILPYNYNPTQIGQFVENQSDYLHINALDCNSNYFDSLINVQTQEKTNISTGIYQINERSSSQYKNMSFSMSNFPNIYGGENASHSSPNSETGEFSPYTQNFNHFILMTPPHSENASPKNSPTSVNRLNHNENFSRETSFANNVVDHNSINNTINSTNNTLNSTNKSINSTNKSINSTNKSINSTNNKMNSTNKSINSTNKSINSTNNTMNSTNDTIKSMNNTINSTNCNATPLYMKASSEYLSPHSGLSSTVLSPVSSLGHRSPECSSTPKIFSDSNFNVAESENINETLASTKVKTAKDVFAEAYEKLGADLRKGICLKIHSMQENDLLNLLHAIMKDISQSNAREIMNISLLHLTCERILMSKPNVFIDSGSKLLHTSAIACYRIPILTKYLSECVSKAHRLLVERGLAEGDRKVILEECDINGNTLLHRLVIQGDAFSQSLAAVLLNKDTLFDVEKLNSDGYSALHLATTKNGIPFSVQDFSSGENIGLARIGETRSTLRMAELLLHRGNADVMYRDGKSGNTCLHLAVEAISCDVRLVTTILKASNREQRKNLVNCRNYSGSTPLDLARAALKSSTRPNYPKSVIDKMKKWK